MNLATEAQMIQQTEREAEESERENEEHPKWKQEILEWAESLQIACDEDEVETKRKREQHVVPKERAEIERETKKRRGE